MIPYILNYSHPIVQIFLKMSLRMLLRSFSKLEKRPDKPLQVTSPQKSAMLTSLYRSTNKFFPRMVPRLLRFQWSDLVIYCEIFFVGLMVYIHFIDP